jgi:hypothetical protein
MELKIGCEHTSLAKGLRPTAAVTSRRVHPGNVI